MMQSHTFSRKSVWGWMLYDWANSAFALTVMAAFFPVLFKRYWCEAYPAAFSTIRLNLGTAAAGLCIALLSPLLGALADAGKSRKLFLFVFMSMGVVTTSLLAMVPQSMWLVALAVFGMANVGFTGANLFYDALLPCVASPQRMDRVSSNGFAIGYLGCAVLFALNLWMVIVPQRFGFADKAAATRATFITVSVWWLLFSIPLLLWVKEPGGADRRSLRLVVTGGLLQLGATARDIMRRRPLWMFLLAYWCYIDGVDTFIRAAVDLGLSIGIDDTGLLISLLVVQLVAFPFAWLFGLAAGRIGTRKALLLGIGIYLLITLSGPFIVRTPLQFGAFAALSAVPIGALQALSRSYWARIIPPEKSAEYFGFYCLIGKFSVVLGPVVLAAVAATVRGFGGSSSLAARWGFASISIFFVAGAALLLAQKEAA